MESHFEKIESELTEMRQELSAMMDIVKEGPPNPSMGAVTACLVTSLIAIGAAVSAHLRIATTTQEANPTIHVERARSTDEEAADYVRDFTNTPRQP